MPKHAVRKKPHPGFRRQNRSPRRFLAFLREHNAASFTEQVGEFRNARRQARADAKAAA